MLVVVKIGTDSVIGNVEKITRDIVSAKAQGIDVILVSSGAVGMGRKIYHNFGVNSVEKQVLASIGQSVLMGEYRAEFEKLGHYVSQILITKNDTERSQERANLQNVMNTIISRKNIVPIVNENDTVSIQEIMFTDNDDLAGMLAMLFAAKRLIILTNVDGIYDDYHSTNRKIIETVCEKDELNIASEKSLSGRGGMQSKVQTARTVAREGIVTTICNVNVSDVIMKVLKGEGVGTSFVPEK